MTSTSRYIAALKAAATHLLLSCLVAALAATLVFLLWYPFPYRELSGGRELFLLVVAVDVVCGPLLTMVVFKPAKPRAELWRDLGLIALLQFAALGYGVHTMRDARPLFLVAELDRFKVVAAAELSDPAASQELAQLPAALTPSFVRGPLTVAIREPHDAEERKKVMVESIEGGRDYGERPAFYLPYEGENAAKSLRRAKPLTRFLHIQPDQQAAAEKVSRDSKIEISELKYLPVVARQDWIAVLDDKGMIQGFLKGDGF